MESVHNFLKCTVAKFICGASLEWDNAFPLPTCCCNVAPSVDSLGSPCYLIHGHDLLKGRLSNLQNFCRYMGNQPRRLAVYELQKLWKLHAKPLAESRMAEPAANKKIINASDLKIGQLVLVNNHHKGPFNSTYIYNHQVVEIINDSMVLLNTPDGKEKKCNIHHVKLVSSLEVYTGSQVEVPIGMFPQFQDSIKQNIKSTSINSCQHLYNLRLKHKHDRYTFSHK